jgi:hypothetical protein
MSARRLLVRLQQVRRVIDALFGGHKLSVGMAAHEIQIQSILGQINSNFHEI